jgi:flagellar biosynthesis protein FlhG
MHDQAAELRQLMHGLEARSPAPAPRPRSIVVWGAARGIGSTTIAVNLTVELSRHGRRVLLVDAEPDGAATRLCQLHEPSAAHRSGMSNGSIVDVYRGRRKLADAISRGRHSLRIVGCHASAARDLPPTDDELATLAAEIPKLGHEADLIVVDAGWGDAPLPRRLSLDADLVLLATTAIDSAVMETYASIKRMTAAGCAAKIAVAVSRTANPTEADDAFARLRHGCQRFLGVALDWAGCVAEDPTVSDATTCAAPFVLLSPRCEAARGIQHVADYVLGVLAPEKSRSAAATSELSRHQEAELSGAAISEAA